MICAQCHQKGTGCCVISEYSEGIQIGLTLPEIFRIIHETGKTMNEFIVRDEIDQVIIESLTQNIHPVFGKIFHNNLRYKLKTEQGKCTFLSSDGCVLSLPSRPHYCRLYPLWFLDDNESLQVLLNPSCLAQVNSRNISELTAILNTDKPSLKEIFNQLLEDAEDHVREIGDYFNKKPETAFTFRLLTAEDKPEIMEMVKNIWEGDDYIPYVYDYWIQGHNGRFYGAFWQERPVGVARISFYVKGYAWLEGLRADPKSPVRGIAKAFNAFLIQTVQQMPEIKEIEFLTYYANFSSINSAESFGFRKIAYYSYKFIRLSECRNTSPDLRVKTEICYQGQELYDLFINDVFFQQQRIGSGEKSFPMNVDFIAQTYCGNKNQWYYQSGEERKAFAVVQFDDARRCCHIIYLKFSEKEGLFAIFDALLYESRLRDYVSMDLLLIPDYPHYDLLSEYGFISYEQENDFIVFRYQPKL